jgi:hypothetical protein
MNYGIIFQNNIPYSVRVFKIQKNITAIIPGIPGGRSKNSCRDLLKT